MVRLMVKLRIFDVIEHDTVMIDLHLGGTMPF